MIFRNALSRLIQDPRNHADAKRRTQSRRRQQLARLLQHENLESRQLLAADVEVGQILGLTPQQLQATAAEGIQRWEASGISQQQLETLKGLQYQIAELGQSNLARLEGELITIDDNAAGNLWFVDSTLSIDEEFDSTTGAMLAPAGSIAYGKMD
ncbi:MAG: hypothetical protein AAFP69_22990, partial [Planctomycetota bacterium]